MWEIVTVPVPGRILLINIRASPVFVVRCHRGEAGNIKLSHLSKAPPWVKRRKKKKKDSRKCFCTYLRL